MDPVVLQDKTMMTITPIVLLFSSLIFSYFTNMRFDITDNDWESLLTSSDAQKVNNRVEKNERKRNINKNNDVGTNTNA